MEIYKDYTTDELILDMPCYIDGIGEIYPIKIKEYRKFLSLAPYLRITKEKLDIEENIPNLQILFMVAIGIKAEEGSETPEEDFLDDMKNLLKLITKHDFELVMDDFKNGDIRFISESEEGFFEINEENFETLRDVVLKQNLIIEEKKYKDKTVEMWAKKARKAKEKEKGIEFAEIVSIVKNNTGMLYKDILEQNIFQIHMDFRTITIGKSYDTSVLFKTVSSDIADVDYTNLNIEEMFKPKEYLISADRLYNKI